MGFEVQRGRVKVAKEIRKVRARKDSLDDHSTDSDEEEYVPKRRGRQTEEEEESQRLRDQAKAEAKAEAEALLADIQAKEAAEVEAKAAVKPEV